MQNKPNKINLFFEYIKDDKLDQSIQFFQKELLKRKNSNRYFLIKEISDSLVVISSELANLNKNNIIGVIDRDQYNLERNRIVIRLVKLGNKYNSIKLPDSLKPIEYTSEEIQKTLYLLEKKFDPNGKYIKNTKKILLNDISGFIVENIMEIFNESFAVNKIETDNIALLLSKSHQLTNDTMLQEFEKRILNWLDRPEIERHIYRIINHWSELNTKYIEDEIKYVYKMHGINPDEFWVGCHIMYPEIKISPAKWSKIIVDATFGAVKEGKNMVGAPLYLGYLWVKGVRVNNSKKSYNITDLVIEGKFKEIIDKEVEQNIYIQKSINVFSDDWILNNVVLQFEYLRLLNQSR